MEQELFKTNSQKDSDEKFEQVLQNLAPKEQAPEPVAEPAPTPEKVKVPEPPKEPEKAPEAEPPKEAPAKEEIKKEPSEAPVFKLDEFNKSFGTSFEDEDSLKGYLSRREELNRLEELENTKKELEAKYDEAREQLNPRKHFVSDDEYKRQLILQKYGEEVNPALLNKIVSQDTSKMTDLDVLILGKQVGNPTLIGGDEGARQLIYDQFGIDSEEMGTDPDKWSQLIKNRLSDAAAPVRKSLNELKKVELPQVEDFEAQRQATIKAAGELKIKQSETWTKVVDRLIKDFKEYKYLEDKAYAVDDDFRAMAKDVLLSHLVDNDFEPNEENIQKARVYLESEFWQQRGVDILKAHAKDIESKFTEEKMKEDDNPKPRNEAEQPASEADKQAQEIKAYLDEGKSTGKTIKLG